MLGKVENNEQKTAAKHNRIHLYLPAAVWPCMWTVLACNCHALYTLNTKHTKCRGKEQVWSQLYKVEHRPVCSCLRSPNHERGTFMQNGSPEPVYLILPIQRRHL